MRAALNGKKIGGLRVRVGQTDGSKLIQEIYGANPMKEVDIWIATK